MEFNLPSQIVKNLSVVLMDPVENIGATLIKEAASNTVREAGDGTTTATVIAHSLLKNINEYKGEEQIRDIKRSVDECLEEVTNYLDNTRIEVEGDMLQQVAYISCNNDFELGSKIGEAFERVGKTGVVLMEDSDTNETHVEFVEGTQFESGIKSSHLLTDKDKGVAVLEEPLVLIVSSPVPNIRRIQNILEHVVKTKRSLLIIAPLEQQPFATLLANKVKGNIKVNIVDPPGFGLEDLAILTGATVVDEELGDDLDLLDINVLGEVLKSVTDAKNTILQIKDTTLDLTERIEEVKSKIDKETNAYIKVKLEKRLSMLTGKVGVIYVGADSAVELKEKKDRVDDALHATKAALIEGIVAGGGIALLNAANKIKPKNDGYKLLLDSIKSPFYTILDNAGIVEIKKQTIKNRGIDVKTGKEVNMIKAGIIDPVLVTKSALKNAVSVVKTIISADCIISNVRSLESN